MEHRQRHLEPLAGAVPRRREGGTHQDERPLLHEADGRRPRNRPSGLTIAEPSTCRGIAVQALAWSTVRMLAR